MFSQFKFSQMMKNHNKINRVQDLLWMLQMNKARRLPSNKIYYDLKRIFLI